MPIVDLEREMRDLFTRIVDAGRRDGERAATERIINAVREAAAGAPEAAVAAAAPRSPAETPAANRTEPPARPPATGQGGAPVEKLPPYWRPR